MATTARPWRTILFCGIIIVVVLMLGAVDDALQISGTCMFVLMAYFAAVAGTYPVLAVNRTGTGIVVMLPYALIGILPLYFFDWRQTHSLVGAWAVVAWTAAGPLIGACMDLAHLATARYSERTRAILIGTAMQTAQFVVALVGLQYLYVPASSMAAHVYLYSQRWLFTLPWMALNGAFGGYTAYALRKRV
jgi:hypothetical protein